MQALNMFFPLTKVDAAQRLVWGLATAETEDRAGEICDYASTKPLYQKWSREMMKASEGRSLGNLRAMHGKIAAGKITALVFDDAARQIEICAKVVDDAEWRKVCEGVYTGFSQGGLYVDRWQDEEGRLRYTAEPAEVSLVDLPCLPDATFRLIKADGAEQEIPFARSAQSHSPSASVAKIGARNNAADLEKIQAMHDASVELGAACPHAQWDESEKAVSGGQLAPLTQDMRKLIAERGRLDKALAAIVPVLDDILQRVKSLEARPRPAPIPAGSRAVDKSQDVVSRLARDPDLAARLSASEREALSLEAIKDAHRQPQPLSLRA